MPQQATQPGQPGDVTINGACPAIKCPRYLVSTNGARFGHPADEAIARILVHGHPDRKQLFFNYTSERNRYWASSDLMKKYGYEAFYPKAGEEGILVLL